MNRFYIQKNIPKIVHLLIWYNKKHLRVIEFLSYMFFIFDWHYRRHFHGQCIKLKSIIRSGKWSPLCFYHSSCTLCFSASWACACVFIIPPWSRVLCKESCSHSSQDWVLIQFVRICCSPALFAARPISLTRPDPTRPDPSLALHTVWPLILANPNPSSPFQYPIDLSSSPLNFSFFGCSIGIYFILFSLVMPQFGLPPSIFFPTPPNPSP